MADSGSWILGGWRGGSPFSLVQSLVVVDGMGSPWSSGRGRTGSSAGSLLLRSTAATATPVQQCFPPGAVNSSSALWGNWPSSD